MERFPGQLSLTQLPREILVEEIMKKAGLPSLYVLSKTNRLFRHILSNFKIASNPINLFARLGYENLLIWDQEGPRPSALSSEATRSACEGGHMRCLEYLVSRKFPVQSNCFLSAASRGDLDILKYLKSLNVVPTTFALNNAAKENHLDAVRYLLSIGIRPDYYTLKDAALSGNVKLLDYIVNVGRITPSEAMVPSLAARSGNLEVLEWAKKHKLPISDPLIYPEASKGGHVHILNYAFDHGVVLDKVLKRTHASKYFTDDPTFDSIQSAILGNYPDVLKWLFDHGFPVFDPRFEDIWFKSVVEGKEAVVLFGIKHGLSLTSKIYAASIKAGLPALRALLDERKCPIDYFSLQAAAEIGRLDIIKMLRNRGVDWDDRVSTAAARRSDPRILKWLIGNGCPHSNILTAAITSSSFLNVQYALDVLQYKMTRTDYLNVFKINRSPEVVRLCLQLVQREPIPKVSNDDVWKEAICRHQICIPILNAMLDCGLALTKNCWQFARDTSKPGFFSESMSWLKKNNCPLPLDPPTKIIDPHDEEYEFLYH